MGRPLNPLVEDVEDVEDVIEFENGSTIEMRDGRATVNHDGAETVPAATASPSCPP